jgi:aquaporin Z
MLPPLAGALVAEAFGLFALSFVGILAIHQLGQAPTGLIGIAIAQGLILAIAITIAAPISGGHINPAVTIGLLALGKIKPSAAIAYIVAQCVGGLLAGLAIMALIKANGAAIVANGTPVIALNTAREPLITIPGAVVAEAITTFFLMMAVLGTAVDPRAPKIGGFGIGLTVTADILAIGPLTGAAMNPARAFGPALAASMGHADIPWSQHWIYWVAPIAGALAASLLYRLFFEPRSAR